MDTVLYALIYFLLIAGALALSIVFVFAIIFLVLLIIDLINTYLDSMCD